MNVSEFLKGAGWVKGMYNYDWFFPDANHPHLHLRIDNAHADLGDQKTATRQQLQAGYRALCDGHVVFLALSSGAVEGVYTVEFIRDGRVMPALGKVQQRVQTFADQLRTAQRAVDEGRLVKIVRCVDDYFGMALLG